MNLKPSRHIIKQNWMELPQTRKVFEILQDSSAEPQILFVGGCVRNALMSRAVEDIDFATRHSPQEVINLLEAQNITVIPTGMQHGTVMAVLDGHSFEITTLRRDVETDGRHAVVDFTQCWIEDAQRRDFSMNTLLMDLNGAVYDPLGHGIADLDAGIIRFVGEPKKRIEEDYLRILRFFRFHALYGDGAFDSRGLLACTEAADKISSLSRERITAEFFKIIASDKASEILGVMFKHKVLKEIAFTQEEHKFFEYFCTFQSRYSLGVLSSRLFVFAGLRFDKIDTMGKYILFPKVFLKDMQAIKGALHLPDLSCDKAVRESIYRFGRSMTAQALMIELVQDRVMNGYAPTALKIIQNWQIPDFPVSGNDLIQHGFKQGEKMGHTLRELEEWWVAQDFKPNKEDLFKKIIIRRGE